MMNKFTMTSVLTSNMGLLYVILLLFVGTVGYFTLHGLDKNMTCTETTRTSEIYR